MIWNTAKSINSIIWSDFKKNKILFILPMLLSVVSHLFDVYNSRMLKSMIDGLLAEVSESKINSSYFTVGLFAVYFKKYFSNEKDAIRQ